MQQQWGDILLTLQEKKRKKEMLVSRVQPAFDTLLQV